jgi:hypothetical protein
VGFRGLDQYIRRVTSGQRQIVLWHKVASAPAGIVTKMWCNTFTWQGYPLGHVIDGTPLTFVPLGASSQGALDIGAARQPATRHLLGSEIVAAYQFGPAWWMLVDLLGYYPYINLTSNALQNFVGVAGQSVLPLRDGVQAAPAGVQMFFEHQSIGGGWATAPTCAAGAFNYTDQALVGGRTNPWPIALWLAGYANFGGGHITNSGPASVGYQGMPVVSLAAGDAGIASVQGLTFTTPCVLGGWGAAFLFRPIATLSMQALIGYPASREFLFGHPSLPTIPDNACLAWLVCPSAPGTISGGYTQFHGTMEYVWG